MHTLVRAAALTNYMQVAEQLGLNPIEQLREVGLTPGMLEPRDRLISLDSTVRLLERSASKANCPNFGLRMAELRQLAHFGVTSILLSHQRCPRDVLQMTIQYRHVLNESLALYLEESHGTCVIREEILTDEPMPLVQATELALAVIVQMFRAIAGVHWRPQTVHFTHAAPATLEVHRRVFKCRIEFDSDFNGISCPASDLDIPNPAADPMMAQYARHFIDTLPAHNANPVVTNVKRAIYLLLPMGKATIEQVALSMGTSIRSLQRDLDLHQESFSQLLNGIRRELALRYMENARFEIGHVAVQLGYSRHASFTRWFIQQFGMSPARWRHHRRLDRHGQGV
ncbi:MAG: AraC family transcriptional regulator [Curvibacter sp.]|nr:AraC family transcriptional regulator [Curvibacter sp.]